MKKISLIALFVLLISFLPFEKVFALNCVQPPPPEIAFHKYDVVVIATVTDIKSSFGYNSINTVNADVSLSFKGNNNNTITFTEDFTWGESKVGRQYLLFLNKKENGLESPLCSPTTETGALNLDTLVENLTAEAASIGNEVIVQPPSDADSDETDESKNSWLLLSAIFIFLMMIAAVILYRRARTKRNSKE